MPSALDSVEQALQPIVDGLAATFDEAVSEHHHNVALAEHEIRCEVVVVGDIEAEQRTASTLQELTRTTRRHPNHGYVAGTGVPGVSIRVEEHIGDRRANGVGTLHREQINGRDRVVRLGIVGDGRGDRARS